MEDLPLGRIGALVPEYAVTDLPLGRTHDDDDYDDEYDQNLSDFSRSLYYTTLMT